MGVNDTFDSCLWKITPGDSCPPFTKAAMCTATE